MYLHQLRLYSEQPDKLAHFYRETLGFPVETSSSGEPTLLTGHSRITFIRSEAPLYYHFAFNIPSSQSREALQWLEERGTVLSDGNSKIIDFSNWNAEAVYFEDPAGNIVEFIARKNLQHHSEAPFSIAKIMGVSEIGLSVPKVLPVYQQLSECCGIEKYSGDFERFCAAGDEHGLFIIVDQGNKDWYPTNKPAMPSPLELTFSQANNSYHLHYDGEEVKIHERN